MGYTLLRALKAYSELAFVAGMSRIILAKDMVLGTGSTTVQED